MAVCFLNSGRPVGRSLIAEFSPESEKPPPGRVKGGNAIRTEAWRISANSDAVASGRKRRRQEPSYEDTSSLNRGEPSANDFRQVFRLHPRGVLRRRDRAGISPASLFSRNDNKEYYGHLKLGSKNEELRWANDIHHDSPCQPPSPFFSQETAGAWLIRPRSEGPGRCRRDPLQSDSDERIHDLNRHRGKQ